MEILIYLSSGLFLGWSLGANDAANVFGTAVGTKMIKFRSAAIICSIFLVLGATVSGSGAAHTLGSLGHVNAIAGSFTVALAAALSVFWMTKLKLPVSTSQAIVGAIIGWNFYTSSITNTQSLTKIVSTWILCPLISAAFAILLYVIIRFLLSRFRIHLLYLDSFTRVGLIIAGAFASYSLGANNIANVMGVFVGSNPFHDISVNGWFTITGIQQLFFLGGVSIAVGVFTYSEKVIKTVGTGLLRISPLSALVVVLAQSLVLFLFASEQLEHFLLDHGLPSIPLVPVSSSQAVVGAVLGIGLLKLGSGLRYKILGEISIGWISAPIIAGVISFVALFFVDNVFEKDVSTELNYELNSKVIIKLEQEGISDRSLASFTEKRFSNSSKLSRELKENTNLPEESLLKVIQHSRTYNFDTSSANIQSIVNQHVVTEKQKNALLELSGKQFQYKWEIVDFLSNIEKEWQYLENLPINKRYNRSLDSKYDYLVRNLQIRDSR